MIRKTLTIFFLLGLLTSAGAWAASYWNWEYTHWKTEVALWGGTLVYRQHDAPPEKDAGWRCYGWISWPQTQWWPRRGSSLTHDWATYPLWMPAALFAVLYYGLKLILLLRSFYREMHDRCRVCGSEVQDSLLCCRKCQTPVSMLTVGRGAFSQVFLHLLVLTIGLTAASYWHYSWTLKGGTTIALSKGSFISSWGAGSKPAKHLAGYSNMKTNWVPKFNSSPFKPPGTMPAILPPTISGGGQPIPSPNLSWPVLRSTTKPGTDPTLGLVTINSLSDLPAELHERLVLETLPAVIPKEGVTLYPQPDGTLRADPSSQSAFLRMLMAAQGPLAPVPPAATPVVGTRTLMIPFWIPLGVIGYVVWRLRFSPANLRRRRIKLGLCLACGYDLRASKERCPECGTEFDADRLILKADR